MVEISMYGSGEGLGWATGRGYSTANSSSPLLTMGAGFFAGGLQIIAPFGQRLQLPGKDCTHYPLHLQVGLLLCRRR